MRLEVVIELTKGRYKNVGADDEAMINLMEIRPANRAYGLPIFEWKGQQFVSPWFDVIPTKALITQTFKLVAKNGYDMNSIDKIVAYKRISDLEFERMYSWIRGQPFKNEELSL
jgi:hypothetical protein